MRVHIRLVMLLLLCFSQAALAQADLDKLLAKPASPGSLAVVLPHAKDARVQARWIEALAHSDPRVRAAAARLLHAVGNRAAVPAFIEALTKEADLPSAVEMSLALVALADGHADAQVLEAGQRFDGRSFALAVSRARGPSAVTHLRRFQALRLDAPSWREVLSSIVTKESSALDTVASVALETEDTLLWQAALESAQMWQLPVGVAQLDAALASPSAAIRHPAWWHIAGAVARGEPVPRREKLLSMLSDGTNEAAPSETFARELTARALGRSVVNRSELLKNAKMSGSLELPAWATGTLNRLLTDGEREVLEAPTPGEVQEFKQTAARDSPKSTRRDYQSIRTVNDFPAGFIAGVLQETGCKPGNKDAFAAVSVRYTKARSVGEAKWSGAELPRDCADAARILMAAALVSRFPLEPGEEALVVLPMHKTFLQCAIHEAERVRFIRPRAIGPGPHGVPPPKKTRHVDPTYPAGAQQRGESGNAVIQAVISPAGCVSSAESMRPGVPELDVAAIRAVSGWTFAPSTVDGEAVPVLLHVNMRFSQ